MSSTDATQQSLLQHPKVVEGARFVAVGSLIVSAAVLALSLGLHFGDMIAGANTPKTAQTALVAGNIFTVSAAAVILDGAGGAE